jgi:hypothetical protein
MTLCVSEGIDDPPFALVALSAAFLVGWGPTTLPRVTATAASGLAISRPTGEHASMPSDTPVVLIGAGDICVTPNIDDARATAKLVAGEAAAQVFTLGDNSNETGTAQQYLVRTRAAAGNHDYYADGGISYFAYFGKAAGPAGQGYYSYDVGAWHVIVLNAQCSYVGGCDHGSPQERWLVADLAAHPRLCTLAYWHQPRFSSGAPGQASDRAYEAFWDDLYAYRADVVLNGHAHDYERFAPQTPIGEASPTGIREFVVGTGGAGQLPLGTVEPNSEVRHTGTEGVLRLTLRASSYDWRFLPVPGETFTDAGTGTCQ